MARLRYDREVTDGEFRQRVRQHTPSSLLPLVAAAGARYDGHLHAIMASPGSDQMYRPWSLAEIARTSLVYGTEFKRSLATEDDLLSILCAHAALRDTELRRQEPGGVARFFLRVSGEQLVYQQTVFNELARTVALYQQTESARVSRVLTRPRWSEELLGCTLSDFVGIGLLLRTSAKMNAGRFSLGWLDQPNFADLVAEVSADTIRTVVHDRLEADVDQFRAEQRSAQALPADSRRFGYNPLSRWPLLRGLATDSLIPVPHLLIHRVSPLGIYYDGARQWGDDFTQDAGWLFEAYVGRQLRSIEEATVLPAIEYDVGRQRRETVDWIVVFKDVVLLVEVKSVRPTAAVRAGTSEAETETTRMLGRAVTQLNNTARLISERHSALSMVPADRPLVGLVVTMEPFHVINGPFFGGWLPEPELPMSICSASDLEHLVCIAEPATTLLHVLQDAERPGWSLKELIRGRPQVRNAVLDAAWATFPWTGASDET